MVTSLTGRQCEKLIKAGRYEYNDMLQKLDIFLLGDRITQEEYTYLKGLMDAQQAPVT